MLFALTTILIQKVTLCLQNFFDVIPTNNNLEEYEKVIDILKTQKILIITRGTASGLLFLKKY